MSRSHPWEVYHRVGSWYALEKKEEHYLAFLHLACAQLIFAKILVFG